METLDIEDRLHEGKLRFRLKDGASYIRMKESKNFYPSSVSTYTSGGSSLIRWNITGPPNQWLDCKSLVMGFTLNNTDETTGHILRPIEANAFFSRIRVLMGDVVVCDLTSLPRVEKMHDVLKSSDQKRIDENLGFGNSFMNNDHRFLSVTTTDEGDIEDRVRRSVSTSNMQGINPKSFVNVFYDPDLKCFKTVDNFIPISYCPITVEMYLCNNASDPIIVGGASSSFTDANTSKLWSITKPLFKGNVYTLDDSLYAEYSKILETGSLPITFETETIQEQTVSENSEIFTTIVRNVSKLNKIFISFGREVAPAGYDGYVGSFGEIYKWWNAMYHPLAQSTSVLYGGYDSNYDLSASLVIGNQVIPTQEVQGVKEAYLHLMHCSEKPFLIRAEDYQTQKFMFGFNLMKFENSSYTGMNLKNNSNMVLRVKPLDGTTLYTSAVMPKTLYLLLQHECILEIRSNSVSFYD